MNLTEQIEKLAGLFFPKNQIEIICQLDPGKLESDPEMNLAFQRGSLKAEMEFWESVSKLANNGSSPAQEMLYKRLKEFRSTEIKPHD